MKAFRPARPASTAWNITKTLFQILIFWSTFLWFLPMGIQYMEPLLLPGPFRFTGSVLFGWLLFLLSSMGGLWAGMTMATWGQGTPLPLDTARKMVVNGPYAYVRNPMAIAGLAQGLGVAFIIGSFGTILYVFLGGLLWHIAVRPAEEKELLVRFGTAFDRYQKQVRLWIPGKKYIP